MGIDKLASSLDYSVPRMRVLIKTMKIPYYRIGDGKLLLRISEVESCLFGSSQEVNN